jgi:hypothetical protein
VSRSWFIRSVPRYPARFLPTAAKEAHLGRRVPVRPARFVVGLEEHEEPWPAEVVGQLQGAPQRAAIYLGRVEEVGPKGELTVTVWETPSGREAVTTLSAGDAVILPELTTEQRPEIGDLLRIWTWIELDERGNQTPRVVYRVVPDEPDQADLARLDQVISALKEGVR